MCRVIDGRKEETQFLEILLLIEWLFPYNERPKKKTESAKEFTR